MISSGGSIGARRSCNGTRRGGADHLPGHLVVGSLDVACLLAVTVEVLSAFLRVVVGGLVFCR